MTFLNSERIHVKKEYYLNIKRGEIVIFLHKKCLQKFF